MCYEGKKCFIDNVSWRKERRGRKKRIEKESNKKSMTEGRKRWKRRREIKGEDWEEIEE